MGQAVSARDSRSAYTDRVREDFDRLADLPESGGWDHNAHYHPFLLKQLPPRLDEALEVGCGTGAFARLLAKRCGTVVAIDLSPRMVEVARARSWEHPNVEYVVAAASWEFPQERFRVRGNAYHTLGEVRRAREMELGEPT